MNEMVEPSVEDGPVIDILDDPELLEEIVKYNSEEDSTDER